MTDASLDNVVSVSLLPQGASIAPDNMNVVCLMTSQAGHLSTNKRFDVYYDAPSIATDFGTGSAVYDHALTFFGTKPNAVQAGGALVVGFWRAADEAFAASAATLTSKQHDPAVLIPLLQEISAGSFDMKFNNDMAATDFTGLDFRTCLTLEDVAAIVNTAIAAKGTCAVVNNSFVITSLTTGATSALTFATADVTGTFVGVLLGIAANTGAVIVAGAASGTNAAETKLAGVTAVKALVNFKGFVFIDQTTDEDVAALAAFTQANNCMSYDVFGDSEYLEVDPSNPVWAIKLASQNQYRCLYSPANNRKFATSYMARMHVVNFFAQNTALTMNLKTLNVPAESFSQGDLDSAQNVGMDVYTTFKTVPKVLCSGANDFADNPYNLIAYIDQVQTDMFNLLGSTATKIPQTTRGVNQMVDQAEQSTRIFVKAGVFAPGTWDSPDSFGDLDTFNANIEQFGFYVMAGLLSDQSTAERQARVSPPLQVAVKNAGAVHKADVIIFFNL